MHDALPAATVPKHRSKSPSSPAVPRKRTGPPGTPPFTVAVKVIGVCGTAGFAELATVVVVASVVSAGLAAGIVVSLQGRAAPPAPPPAAQLVPSPETAKRLADVEARLEELAASLDRATKEHAALHADAQKRVDALVAENAALKLEADAAASLVAGYSGEAKPEAAKRTDMDAFAKEVAKGMRQGLRQEFRKISDLVTAPTAEALDQRRRQLKMVAAAFGTNAGLDQAQVATLERILNETDERARDDLRPILQGVEDYRKVDYGKVRKVTDDAFVAQDQQFEKEFPKDKSDALKQQLSPVRTVFGAMIDELQKESEAAPR